MSYGKQYVTCLRNRKARILFTEGVAYHYLYHSLFHCYNLKIKSHTHGVFCKHRFWLKKFLTLFLQRKCRFRHHKTCPEKKESAPHHTVLSPNQMFLCPLKWQRTGSFLLTCGFIWGFRHQWPDKTWYQEIFLMNRVCTRWICLTYASYP